MPSERAREWRRERKEGRPGVLGQSDQRPGDVVKTTSRLAREDGAVSTIPVQTVARSTRGRSDEVSVTAPPRKMIRPGGCRVGVSRRRQGRHWTGRSFSSPFLSTAGSALAPINLRKESVQSALSLSLPALVSLRRVGQRGLLNSRRTPACACVRAPVRACVSVCAQSAASRPKCPVCAPLCLAPRPASCLPPKPAPEAFSAGLLKPLATTILCFALLCLAWPCLAQRIVAASPYRPPARPSTRVWPV